MKLILLLCCLAYTNAQLKNLLLGYGINIGSYDGNVRIGNLSSHYVPITNNDRTASINARQLIEKLRRMFHVGIFTLPPLDPYVQRNFPPISMDDLFVSGRIYLNNLVMKGAKQFKLNLMEMRLNSNRVDFSLSLPRLNVDVDVKTGLNIGSIFPLNVKGHVNGLLSDVYIEGALVITPARAGIKRVYQISALHSHVKIRNIQVKFDGPKIDVSGLNEDGAMDRMSFVEKIEQKIADYVAQNVITEANKALSGLTVEQVLAYLLPATRRADYY